MSQVDNFALNLPEVFFIYTEGSEQQGRPVLE